MGSLANKKNNGWRELKRDIPDHMLKKYASDRNIYKIKDMNQDVDWRFCIHLSKRTSLRILPHVNPYTRMKKLLTRRDTENCYVSKVFKEHKKDWDFMVRYRDSLFKSKGFSKNTPITEKLKAISYDIGLNHELSSGEFLHPVDIIVHGGWCTGQSASTIAVAHTMGLEGRSILVDRGLKGGHTNSEIRINGKWHFCENIDKEATIDKKLNFRKRKEVPIMHLIHKNWMEVVANPDACKEIPSKVQKQYYKDVDIRGCLYCYSISTHWHMSTIGSYLWFKLTPYTAKALYPEIKTFPLRPLKHKTDKIWLWDGINWDEGFGWDTLRYQTVRQKQGVRKNFYLSGLKDIKKISGHITMVKNNSINLRSKDWYIRINGGKKYYLKDLKCRWKYSGDILFHGGVWWEDLKPKIPKEIKKHLALGWKWHKGKKKENQLCFLLPLKELRANNLNTIELRSDTKGKEYFNVRLFDNPLLPVPRPFYDGR